MRLNCFKHNDAGMNQLITDQLKGKKILFANVPADGNFSPLTGLAKYFQEAGADVRWYASAQI